MRHEGLCRELDSLIELSRSAKSLGIFVAYTVAWVSNTRHPQDILDTEVRRLLEEIPKAYDLKSLRNDPVVRAYRKFYWRIGIDPTKTRPASEALVRRVLRGSFPRINPVVDAGNIASVETLVPIGIYDLSRAEPPFKIILSRGGEVFRPIGGEPERLPPNIPIFIDARGTVMHVYPHRDSIDTMIREDTEEVLIVAAGVPDVPVSTVRKAAVRVAELLVKLGWSWCETAHILTSSSMTA